MCNGGFVKKLTILFFIFYTSNIFSLGKTREIWAQLHCDYDCNYSLEDLSDGSALIVRNSFLPVDCESIRFFTVQDHGDGTVSVKRIDDPARYL